VKFFVPETNSAEQATWVYGGIRNFVAGNMGSLSPSRIYWLTYRDKEKLLKAEVGKLHPLIGEVIVAIFASRLHDLYFICTENRGASRGNPIIAGAAEATFENFDDEKKP
jgi:hypothetical protein